MASVTSPQTRVCRRHSRCRGSDPYRAELHGPREHTLVLDFKPCETFGSLHKRLFSYDLVALTGEGALAAFLRNGGYYPNEAAVSPNEAELWSCDGRELFLFGKVLHSCRAAYALSKKKHGRDALPLTAEGTTATQQLPSCCQGRSQRERQPRPPLLSHQRGVRLC
jgi:hypothetical protein